MRVRIAYTIEVGDAYRRALAHRKGDHGGMATREDIRAHNEAYGAAFDDDLGWEYDRCPECDPGMDDEE